MMIEGVTIQPAGETDVDEIVSVLHSNRDDPALFLRSLRNITRHLADFIVARDASGRVLACAAVDNCHPALGEILSVAVHPAAQRRGLGSALMEECIRKASGLGVEQLWLATSKPDFFSQFGFEPISRWQLPAAVLLNKLVQVAGQPLRRWLPALTGSFVFMARTLAIEEGSLRRATP
jgi:amino-acid N-acetyltransferase